MKIIVRVTTIEQKNNRMYLGVQRFYLQRGTRVRALQTGDRLLGGQDPTALARQKALLPHATKKVVTSRERVSKVLGGYRGANTLDPKGALNHKYRESGHRGAKKNDNPRGGHPLTTRLAVGLDIY